MSLPLPSVRPLDPLLSSLIDAAHDTHKDRNLLHPRTQQYAMFEWQLQEAEAERRASADAELSSRQAAGAGSTTSAASRASRRKSGTASSQIMRSSIGVLSIASFDLSANGPPAPNLEVTCEFDANFQAAGIAGGKGHVVRPLPQAQIGPVALLFRWYTKRATQFIAGFPRPGGPEDAPTMPPPDLLSEGQPKAAANQPSKAKAESLRQSSGSFAGTASVPSSSSISEPLPTSPFLSGSTRGRSGPLTTVPASELCSSASSPAIKTPPPSGSGSATNVMLVPTWDEGLPAHGGRSLNRAPDPVMSLTELCDMLEEMDILPHLVCRHDVALAFKAAAQVPCTPEGQLPYGQVRPDELRYPQFCDVLIRLALAADARQALELGRPQHSPISAVHALMEAMDLANPNVTLLKRRLDELARMASDRGLKRKAIKWMYISPQSGMAAASTRPSLLPSGWTVDSLVAAPEQLLKELLSSDVAAAKKYLPNWKEFPLPALDLSVVQPGELRCLRLVLRNRAPDGAMALRIDTAGAASNLAVSFNEHPLPAGVPRVLDIDACFERPGEYTGEIRIFSRVKPVGEQHVNVVPFYALVPGSDVESRFPKQRSERLAYVGKTHRALGSTVSSSGTAQSHSGSLLGSLMMSPRPPPEGVPPNE